jgi:hypothetical protein
MQIQFSDETITHIIEQSIIYTCACPAQICKAINTHRALFNYQQQCLNATNTDKAVHQAIATAAATIHAQLEECLEKVLRLGGWDMQTFQMPEAMKKRLLDELDNSLQ